MYLTFKKMALSYSKGAPVDEGIDVVQSYSGKSWTECDAPPATGLDAVEKRCNGRGRHCTCRVEKCCSCLVVHSLMHSGRVRVVTERS